MSAVAQTTAFAGRTLRRFGRSPGQLASIVAFPLLMLFLQLAAFGDLVGTVGTTRYVDRVVPLVILLTVALGAAVTSQAMFADLHAGLYDRIRTMPVARLSPVLGRVVGDLVRILAVALVTTVVAHAVGFRFSMGAPAAVAFFGVVLLVGSAWTWVGVLVAVLASREEVVQSALGPPGLLLFFLSSGFVPIEAFPGVLQPVVRINPFSLADTTMIGLSSGGPIADALVATLAWTLGSNVLVGAVTLRILARGRR